MNNSVYRYKNIILLTIKILIFLSFCAVFTFIAYNNYSFTKFFSINLGTSTSTYGALVLLFSYIYEGFKLGENRISDVVYSLSLSAAISLFFTYFQLCILFNDWLNFWPIISAIVASCALSVICAILFSILYNKFYPPKKTAVVYSNATDIDNLLKKIYARPDKYNVKKIKNISEGLNYILDSISECELVIICDLDTSQREAMINYCYERNISVFFKATVSNIIIHHSSFEQISDTPFLACRYKELSFEQRILKRLLDIVVASLMLLVSSPIMILTAIAIKLYDKGPVFFTQNRVTLHNKVFKLYKFRSMIVDAEKDGVAKLASKNDDRITPIGKVIRMLRIDELPQIINVLKGDLSIVGPRPERPELISKYLLSCPAFEYRTKVKAGITGFAQIKGKYNTSYMDKLMMDLMYIESFSILQDLKLIFLTIKIVFIPESSEGI